MRAQRTEQRVAGAIALIVEVWPGGGSPWQGLWRATVLARVIESFVYIPCALIISLLKPTKKVIKLSK